MIEHDLPVHLDKSWPSCPSVPSFFAHRQPFRYTLSPLPGARISAYLKGGEICLTSLTNARRIRSGLSYENCVSGLPRSQSHVWLPESVSEQCCRAELPSRSPKRRLPARLKPCLLRLPRLRAASNRPS